MPGVNMLLTRGLKTASVSSCRLDEVVRIMHTGHACDDNDVSHLVPSRPFPWIVLLGKILNL